MTIRERLQIIGQAVIGKQPVQDVAQSVTKQVEKQIGGSFLDFKRIGLSNNKTVSSKVLEANKGWVYRNTDAIATEVSGIEFELFSVNVVKNEIQFNPITSHPALDALDRFNSFTDASSGFYITESHRLLAGDAFWYIQGKKENVVGIYSLQPDKIELEFGKVAGSQVIIDKYKFEDNVEGKPLKAEYRPDEIIHFKIPNAKNPYRGYGKVEAAADDIDLDSMAVEANKQLYMRGLISNFVLTTPNKLTDEQLKQLHAEFKSSYGGVENSFKVPIFGSDLKPVSTQVTNRDMQFLEHQEWLRDKITAVWGNNKAAIGITDDVNRANADASITLWRASTIRSEMKAITDTLNEFYIPRFGENLIIGFKDPVGETEAEQIEKAKSLKGADIITLNEAREILGYENIDGGDEMAFQRSERQAKDNAQLANVPKSLKYVKLDRHFRKWGLYKKIDDYNALLPAARKMAEKTIKGRRKEEVREHPIFTNDKVWDFQSKQLHIVDIQEEVFQEKVERYIKGLVDRALENVPEEVALMQSKALINQEEEIVRAVLDFAPILNEVALLSGQQAINFIGDETIYLAMDIRKTIEAQVRKFAQSLIETDKNKLIDIIARGLSNGDSVPKIRRNIVEQFNEFSKMQAERIARTEVIRTSNLGTIDAWKQSGIVTGKQWLTAMDDRVDPLCSYMNGKVMVGLDKNYFDKGEILEVEDHKVDFSYGSVKVPPLHPNCRCTLLPVLLDERAFDSETYLKIKGLEQDKLDLEAKVDKRKKEFKEIVAKNLDLESYVKELEAYLET